MTESIRQKRLKILEYFDAYVFHHYKIVNNNKYMHGNIPRYSVLFV